MIDWHDFLVDSDAFPRDSYVIAVYRIAVDAGVDVRVASTQLARIITHRSQRFDRPLAPEMLSPLVSHIGKKDRWTEVQIAIPRDYWEPSEGLARLYELLASVAEYSFTSGTWLYRIDFNPSYLQEIKGPNNGVQGIRGLTGVDNRPLLAATVGPRGLPIAELVPRLSDSLEAGFDVLVDDMLGGSGSDFETRVGILASLTKQASESGKRKLCLVALSGRPSVMLSNAHLALSLGADGFVVNAFANGLGILEDLALLDAKPVLITTNMGSGMASRPLDTSGEDHAGIDEQVFSKLSRLAGADAVHAGTTGTECYDVNWSDAIRALHQPQPTITGPIQPAMRVAEGDVELAHLWPNIRVLGKDTLFEINTSVSLMDDTARESAVYVEFITALANAENSREAWGLAVKFSKRSTRLAEQLNTNPKIEETWK